MAENKTGSQKKVSADWLIQGVLTKLGDIFDQFTGRDWQPSSNLATSELIERLKKLLDSQVQNVDGKSQVVPHNIKLKMQWDKFSTDSEKAIEKLENELLIAAIDHINDKRYHTFAPIRLEIKPDYFTEGVKLQAGFEKFVDEENRGEIRVAIPDLKVEKLIENEETAAEIPKQKFVAEFEEKGKVRRRELFFAPKQRQSIGRTPENNLIINDPSISKIHAALVLDGENQLMVADTGSTNGTFINDKRISYGKAITIKESDKIKFGTVEVRLKYIPENNEPKKVSENGESKQIAKNYQSKQNAVEETTAKTEVLPAENDLAETQRVSISQVKNEAGDRENFAAKNPQPNGEKDFTQGNLPKTQPEITFED